jgi:hypothetical protein
MRSSVSPPYCRRLGDSPAPFGQGGGPVRPLESQHHIRRCRQLRAVGDADARYPEILQDLTDLALFFGIEMRCRFVEEQNFWPPIERPRQDHTLLLAARQGLPMSPIRLL